MISYKSSKLTTTFDKALNRDYLYTLLCNVFIWLIALQLKIAKGDEPEEKLEKYSDWQKEILVINNSRCWPQLLSQFAMIIGFRSPKGSYFIITS